MAPYLLGVAEIAAMLGVTRQRVNQLVRSPGFPAPEAELTAGRIWRRDAIERWVVANPHRATEAGEGAMGNALGPAARAVVLRAQEEAREMRHNYVGTEHLLLACLSDAAADVNRRLGRLGITRAAVLADVAKRCPPGGAAAGGHIPFTPRSTSILTTASRLARDAAGPDHIARAIARVPDGIAAQVMTQRSELTPDELVAELDRLLDTDPPTPRPGTPLRCSFCDRSSAEVTRLIAGIDAHICDACIDAHRSADDEGPLARSQLVADHLDRVADELRHIRELLTRQ